MKSKNPNYRDRALHGVAVSCALVTSASVAITVFELFGGGGIGFLFAFGASALDLYKVLAFSTVVALISAQRYATGVAALVVAVALGFFSAWATSEFLGSAILSKRQHTDALHTQRMADMRNAQQADQSRTVALDKAEADIRAQVAGMRTRGQATKAAEVEANELPKITAEREVIRKRLDETSQAMTAISAEVPKGFALSVDAILAIARGFASFLEIVPAVVMAVTTQQKTRECRVITANSHEFPHDDDETPPPRSQEYVDDVDLVEDLRGVPAGRVVSLTDFARSRQIGKTRATRIFASAVEAGILERTAGRAYRRTMPRLRTVRTA